MSWQTAYLEPDNWTNGFGVPGRFYDSLGHRGTDFREKGNAGRPLLAWETMTCIENAWHDVVGPVTNLRMSDGKVVGVAHTLIGSRPDVGQTLKPGDRIALPAGPGDAHGTAWAGTHFHIVGSHRGPHAGQGYRNEGGLFDMKPRILAAAGRPVTPPKPAPASTSNKPAKVKGQVTDWVRASRIPGAPWVPVGPLMARIQSGLKITSGRARSPRYRGPSDGRAASDTYRGIQITLNVARLNGPKGYTKTAEDALIGPYNAFGIQRYAKKYGGYVGPIDGDPLFYSWLGFAKGINP